jgi:DNA-binding protein YbaB
MREKVDDLLTQFDKRTAQLREARQAAAALTANLTSQDQLVRVSVDATGMLTELKIDPATFDRTTPDALARTIGDLVRRGTTQVRQQTADLMRPLTEGLPDLSDLSPGAPSLADMLPKIPDFPTADRPAVSEPDGDEPASWLQSDDR